MATAAFILCSLTNQAALAVIPTRSDGQRGVQPRQRLRSRYGKCWSKGRHGGCKGWNLVTYNLQRYIEILTWYNSGTNYIRSQVFLRQVAVCRPRLCSDLVSPLWPIWLHNRSHPATPDHVLCSGLVFSLLKSFEHICRDAAGNKFISPAETIHCSADVFVKWHPGLAQFVGRSGI